MIRADFVQKAANDVTHSAWYWKLSPHTDQISILPRSHFGIVAMGYQPLKLFGQHLVELRKAKGWSQERLALESGLDRSHVSRIDRGQCNISLITICILADTLGVPPSELLNFFPGSPPRKHK